jgi:hypothetical protein
VLVVSAARHPLDVLLSILMFSQRENATNKWLAGDGGGEDLLHGHEPGDPAFSEWATSTRARLLLSLTPEWWASPATHRVRYEDLVAEPEAAFRRLIERGDLVAATDLGAAVAGHSSDQIHALSGGVHVGRASPGAWRELLSDELVDTLIAIHHDVFVSLGYDPDDRKLAPS